MNEIKIHIDEDENTPVSTDEIRYDELWTEKNELFLREIQEKCNTLSNKHNVASHKNKKKYVYTAIPTMILPLVLANINLINEFAYKEYINPIGMTVVGIINGFQTLLNFSKKTQLHNEYAGKYAELSGIIDKTLIRRKKFREPFDVILERLTTHYNNLNNNAPYL